MANMPLMIPKETILIGKMMRSSDVQGLSEMANRGAVEGAVMTAISYLAAFRIHQLYKRVEKSPAEVLRRHLKILGHDIPETGATGLRAYYCTTVYGWGTISAWRNDWTSGVPISGSSVWSKMRDIQGWRNTGASWKTVLLLLANTPMAGRDFLEKPVQPEALPPGGESQYLEELADLAPGQARKKVSEDAGEMQVWLADIQWHRGSLLLKVVQEASGGTESYDLIVRQVSSHESWLPVAYWLGQKLGIRMKIGEQDVGQN